MRITGSFWDRCRITCRPEWFGGYVGVLEGDSFVDDVVDDFWGGGEVGER